MASVDDLVIICTYVVLDNGDLENYKGRTILVDENNRVAKIS